MTIINYWIIVNYTALNRDGKDKAYYIGTQGSYVALGSKEDAIKYISYAAAQLVLTGTFGVVLTEANEWDIVKFETN